MNDSNTKNGALKLGLMKPLYFTVSVRRYFYGIPMVKGCFVNTSVHNFVLINAITDSNSSSQSVEQLVVLHFTLMMT